MLCRTPTLSAADLQHLQTMFRCHWTAWMVRRCEPLVARGAGTPEIIAEVVTTTDGLRVLSDCLAIWEFQLRVSGKPEILTVMAPLVHQAFLTLAQQEYEPRGPVSPGLQQAIDDLLAAKPGIVTKLDSAPAVDTNAMLPKLNPKHPPSGMMN